MLVLHTMRAGISAGGREGGSDAAHARPVVGRPALSGERQAGCRLVPSLFGDGLMGNSSSVVNSCEDHRTGWAI